MTRCVHVRKRLSWSTQPVTLRGRRMSSSVPLSVLRIWKHAGRKSCSFPIRYINKSASSSYFVILLRLWPHVIPPATLHQLLCNHKSSKPLRVRSILLTLSWEYQSMRRRTFGLFWIIVMHFKHDKTRVGGTTDGRACLFWIRQMLKQTNRSKSAI
jgi:hypothetical protein